MSDPAFLLGRLLAAADDLHRGYCHDVRGGSFPPMLLGNALLPMAQVRPAGTLAALCRRITPYHGWATRRRNEGFRVDERFRGKADPSKPLSAKARKEKDRQYAISNGMWWAFRLKDLAKDLSGRLTGEAAGRVTDEFKAELLLGYLAGPPEKPRNDDGDAPETGGDD